MGLPGYGVWGNAFLFHNGWTNKAAFCLAKLSAVRAMWQAVFTGEDNGKQQDEAEGGKEGSYMRLLLTHSNLFFIMPTRFISKPNSVWLIGQWWAVGTSLQPMAELELYFATFYKNPSSVGSKVCFSSIFFGFSDFSMWKHIETSRHLFQCNWFSILLSSPNPSLTLFLSALFYSLTPTCTCVQVYIYNIS